MVLKRFLSCIQKRLQLPRGCVGVSAVRILCVLYTRAFIDRV